MENEKPVEEKAKALKEAQIKEKITHLLQKINEAYQQTRTIDDKIVSAYKQLLEEEKKCNRFSQEEGIEFSSNVAGLVSHDLIDTRKAIQKTRETLQKAQLSEDIKQEQIEELEKQLELIFKRIGASDKIASELSEVVRAYKTQSSDIIKRQLYEEAFEMINIARICKLETERREIECEQVGILGRITGKNRLKRMKLDNIDLKLTLLKDAKPEKKKNYSVRDILTDIYTFKVTEMENEETQALNAFFEELRSNFGTNGNRFTIDDIKHLARPKIEEYQRRNLSSNTKKKSGLFGRTREQIDILREENSQMQSQIDSNKGSKIGGIQGEETLDAINLFRQRLKEIYDRFTEEKPTKKQREVTLEL